MPLQNEYRGQAPKVEMPPLGTRISILLDSGIRYEGTLEWIDSDGGKFIILRRVDLYGTEDRLVKPFNDMPPYADYADSMRVTVLRIKKLQIIEDNIEHKQDHVSTSARPEHLAVATSSSASSKINSIEQLTAASSSSESDKSTELPRMQEELKTLQCQVAALKRLNNNDVEKDDEEEWDLCD